jgi:hypothetical protein
VEESRNRYRYVDSIAPPAFALEVTPGGTRRYTVVIPTSWIPPGGSYRAQQKRSVCELWLSINTRRYVSYDYSKR